MGSACAFCNRIATSNGVCESCIKAARHSGVDLGGMMMGKCKIPDERREAKTPEEIARDAIRHGYKVGRQENPGDPTQFARDIRAYGDQRAAEALKEERMQGYHKPEPTIVERAARAIFESNSADWRASQPGQRIATWQELPENLKDMWRSSARAAIAALKTQIPWPNGLEGHFKARSIAEFNAMLDSILTEKQGE